MKRPLIMETRIVPPASISNRVKFYIDKYGIQHALCALIGRRCRIFWYLFGGSVSRKYINRTLKKEDDVVINLGGGSNTNEKYLTVDIDPRADAYANITKPLPFPNNSIANILLEEVIEHFLM